MIEMIAVPCDPDTLEEVEMTYGRHVVIKNPVHNSCIKMVDPKTRKETKINQVFIVGQDLKSLTPVLK